jgi:hypothetical protein
VASLNLRNLRRERPGGENERKREIEKKAAKKAGGAWQSGRLAIRPKTSTARRLGSANSVPDGNDKQREQRRKSWHSVLTACYETKADDSMAARQWRYQNRRENHGKISKICEIEGEKRRDINQSAGMAYEYRAYIERRKYRGVAAIMLKRIGVENLVSNGNRLSQQTQSSVNMCAWWH